MTISVPAQRTALICLSVLLLAEVVSLIWRFHERN